MHPMVVQSLLMKEIFWYLVEWSHLTAMLQRPSTLLTKEVGEDFIQRIVG